MVPLCGPLKGTAENKRRALLPKLWLKSSKTAGLGSEVRQLGKEGSGRFHHTESPHPGSRCQGFSPRFTCLPLFTLPSHHSLVLSDQTWLDSSLRQTCALKRFLPSWVSPLRLRKRHHLPGSPAPPACEILTCLSPTKCQHCLGLLLLREG